MLNSYGYFEYGPMSDEIRSLRAEVEDMEDVHLINEALDVPFENDEINDIVGKFMFNGDALTEEDREALIGFYILMHVKQDLEIFDEA